MNLSIRLLACLSVSLITWTAHAQSDVTLIASKDNTLYENVSGAVSNGAGTFLYAGNTANGGTRRALVAFDLSADIPSGSTIQSVALSLTVNREPPGDIARSATIHRVLADWGEGTSNAGSPGGTGAASTAGDATWIHTFFDTDLWTNAGGDFAAASATTIVDDPNVYTWISTPELVADVQAWVDDPSSNFGWMVRVDESLNRTARRLTSREHPVESNRPSVRITFDPPATANEDTPEIPLAATLRSTYPNPFTVSTTVEFDVAEPGAVTLEVYDTLGRRVETLADQWYGSGTHRVTFTPRGLPAGVYFFRLAASEVSTYRQATLLR